MSKHLLLDNAFEFTSKTENSLDTSYVYDNIKGYWKNDNFAIVMDRKIPKPCTKKCDVETGEDMKGQ